jgi:hypothetical protein
MESNRTGQPNQARRLLLGRMSTGLAALGVAPAALWGCGGGNGGEQNLPPSIADGSIKGTTLDGARIALTSITQTSNLNEPVLGRVVLNQQVLPVSVTVSSDILEAFTLVGVTGNVARYQSTFYDSGMVRHPVETTVTELADGYLVTVSIDTGSASLMIPLSLLPQTALAKTSSVRVKPAQGWEEVLIFTVIVLAASWLLAQLIDLAKMALCLAQGGTYYESTIGVVNTPDGQQWGVTAVCKRPTGAVSP